jgi:uncharacterized protein
MKHSFANLPLHGGKAPAWLFQRMRKLAGSLTEIMVMELGQEAFLDRISDPFWFQCLGCVLGFDWHSSGVTTTTCAALKEGIEGREADLGLFICGGKGAASRKTPQQIMNYSARVGTDGDRLVYASRMSAKVDSSALQDGFQVYHHCFIFTRDGKWAVVQQGMNEESGWARRYHWLADKDLNFVCEPHKAVCSDGKPQVFNMVAKEADLLRTAATDASKLPPEKLLSELKLALGDRANKPRRRTAAPRGQREFDLFSDTGEETGNSSEKTVSYAAAKDCRPPYFGKRQQSALLEGGNSLPPLSSTLSLPGRHNIVVTDINPARLKDTFVRTYERQPENFETLLGVEGVGPKTLRALSLVGQLLYGATPSFRDPARFSFAHGGKDGIPFPVDRKTYDTTVNILEKAVSQAKVGQSEKLQAMRRMATFLEK